VFYEKQAYYEANKNNINTVFLGSSLTYRQVNSQLFDSLNSLDGINTSSYNLGYDAATLAETYTTIKYVLDNKQENLKTIVVELSPPRNQLMEHLHSLRRKSFNNVTQAYYSVWLNFGTQTPLAEKLSFFGLDLVNFIESEFGFGMLKDAYKFKKYEQTYKVPNERNDMSPMLANTDSIEQIEFLGKKYKHPHIVFMQTGLPDFKNNTEKVRELFLNIDSYKNADRNKGYETLIYKMLAMAKKKKVRLIFLLPPRCMVYDYANVLPVYLSLPQQNKIELADPNKHPEFYTIESSYDMTHLLAPAANVYTQQFQAQYAALSKQ
jgi:hypothetical protein